MGTPVDKQALIHALDREFERLWDALELVCPGGRERRDVYQELSVKDLVANLEAGEQQFLMCLASEVADDPSTIDLRHVDDEWSLVVDRFCTTHDRVRAAIDALDERALGDRCASGRDSVADCAMASGPDRYRWATRLIRRWVRRPRSATLAPQRHLR